MTETAKKLHELYDRIPRRHTPDNVKEIYSILDEYEGILQGIEAENEYFEKNISPYFDALDPVRALIKKSTDNKASKKTKDDLFDSGSGDLKDSMQELINFYNTGV